MKKSKWGAMLLMLLLATAANAVPAKRGLKKVLTLTDGTTVSAQLVGDEHGHYWLGADGKAYRQQSGTTYYVVADRQAIEQKASARHTKANAKRMKRLPRHAMTTPTDGYIGQKKGLIVLVNFKDKKFADSNNNALYQRIANEENFSEGKFKGSMSDYFKAQSMGKFELDFDIVGPVTVSKSYQYYGQNDSDGNDLYPATMVTEALNLMKDEVTNWSQYDWDNDGYVDQVYFIYAGYGEADTENMDNTIWPHAWTLTEGAEYLDGNGPVMVTNGLYVDTYACGPERDGMSGGVAGIGTMCHEFSHCLGYPDFYDTDYSGGQGMNDWDLMDHGSYNDDGYQPAGYTSYERWVAGWLTPTELSDEDVEITDMKALQDGGEAYIIYNKRQRNEYFLLENRQLTGWDASLPAGGLLILHVDYDASIWESNRPNDEPNHQRMTWMPADGKYQYEMWQGTKYYTWEGEENDPFPYGSKNAFNKSTTPAAKFYNKNSDDTYYMSSSVENIKQNTNGTIAFKFVANYGGSGTGGDDYVKPSIEGALFYESFDQCDGKGGNDDMWSGQIANGDFLCDNTGWSSEKAFGAEQCAKFGTSSLNGNATTPAFAVSGETRLTFRAGAWNARNDGTVLNLSVSKGTITPSTVTMEKGKFTDFEATINATGDVRVTFEAEQGRFFLDEVLVKDPNATAITTIESRHAQTDGKIYTLDGRYVGTDMNLLRHGIYIVNGKKVIK